jgi:hypothetical protein
MLLPCAECPAFGPCAALSPCRRQHGPAEGGQPSMNRALRGSAWAAGKPLTESFGVNDPSLVPRATSEHQCVSIALGHRCAANCSRSRALMSQKKARAPVPRPEQHLLRSYVTSTYGISALLPLSLCLPCRIREPGLCHVKRVPRHNPAASSLAAAADRGSHPLRTIPHGQGIACAISSMGFVAAGISTNTNGGGQDQHGFMWFSQWQTIRRDGSDGSTRGP